MPGKGRSQWLLKPRTVSAQAHRRSLRSVFQTIPLSDEVHAAAVFARKKSSEISKEERIQFLQHFRGAAAKAFKQVAQNGASLSAKTVNYHIDKGIRLMPAVDVRRWFDQAVELIADKASIEYSRMTDDQIRKYFAARKIPLRSEAEEQAFTVAWNAMMGKQRLSRVLEPFDLHRFEQVYLRERRAQKTIFQEIGQYQNDLFRILVGPLRLTSNQRRATLRWVRQNVVRMRSILQEEQAALLRENPLMSWDEQSQRLDARLAELEKELADKSVDFLKTFFPVTLKSKRLPSKAVVIKKPGSRQQRMAEYTAAERETRGRQKAIRTRSVRASQTGKPFDAAAYALQEIEQENHGSAGIFRGLLEKRLLSRNQFVQLFSKGTLAQRIFLDALQYTDFQKEFGSEAIEALARGVSFIGGFGEPRDKAIRAFQGERGRKIFDFLERNGLLNTQHGLDKVYLTRLRINRH